LPRLLLVDDEPDVIEGISRRLRHDFEIFSANDGAHALRVLEEQGEMHIMVSDMRMPVMDGATLLAESYKIYPDMIRILLTGQADLESAVSAVNEGQIFRFLLKPCPGELLRAQLKAALRQHELVIAEKVLLEQTLRGAVQALSEVLSLAMPEAFGKASRIRQRARQLAVKINLLEVWRIEVAAILSQVGAVTLNEGVATKLYKAQPLTPEEQTAVERLPAIANELLKPIPRMNVVRELITQCFAPPGGQAPRSLEARVLRSCVEIDGFLDAGLSVHEGIAQLQRRGFEPELVSELQKLVAAEIEAAQVQALPLHELREGMILAEDVYGSNGTLLLARGNVIKANVIERLGALRSRLGGRQTLRVRLAE
jgi:CheY-like chemotaxis protein